MNRRTMFLSGFVAAVAVALPACVADPPQAAGRAPTITQSELLSKLERSKPEVVVLDVRTAAEFAAGHVPGARNVSHDELPARLDELAALRDKQVVLYCRSGRRTEIAEETLRKAGFTKLLHLEGDWLAWEAEKRPIERPASGPAKPR